MSTISSAFFLLNPMPDNQHRATPEQWAYACADLLAIAAELEGTDAPR